MPRLMSVTLTEQAVVDRTKDVTRRLGWRHLTPGTELDLCRKVMGRRSGDPLVRLARVHVTSIDREPLSDVTTDDVYREGFNPRSLAAYGPAGASLADLFVAYFCAHLRVTPTTEVTRIEWEYLPTPTDWPTP